MEEVASRFILPFYLNSFGLVKHSCEHSWYGEAFLLSTLLVWWLSVRGDSNFPYGGRGWGQIILGRLEWGPTISGITDPPLSWKSHDIKWSHWKGRG